MLWINKTFGLSIPYSTVHRIVTTLFHAKLKVPRPSNIAGDRAKQEAFKANLAQKIKESIPKDYKGVVWLWVQDESRFGLLPIKRRRVTAKGVKPIGRMQLKFKSYYLFGCIEPLTGESFFLEMPNMDGDCFQVFLNQFAIEYPNDFHIMIIDNAPAHRAKAINLPKNMATIELPPVSPELNPIERFWEDVKNQIPYKIFDDLENMKDRVADILKDYTKSAISSLTSYPYIVRAIKELSLTENIKFAYER